MEIPKIPQALVGSIVRSNRDPDRLGRIQYIGPESDRAFVHWTGNAIEIVAEWQYIEIMADPFGRSFDEYLKSCAAELSTEELAELNSIAKDVLKELFY